MAKKHYRGFPGQHKHEEVLLVFRHHLMAIRKQLIIGGLLLVLGLLPLTIWPTSSLAVQILLVFALISFGYMFWAWIGWYYSVYIATNERIIEVRQRGFF